MSSSIFSAVEMAPRDPILGLNESFNADTRTTKVNLGVGVYFDDNGKIPLLNVFQEAEKKRVDAKPPRGYLPIDGSPAYNQAVQHLLFGQDSKLIAEGRVATIQALGGTGALKVGADFLKRLLPQSKIYISDPSWENHRALFESAGFDVATYPYYDAARCGVNVAAMLDCLKTLPAQSIVLLHACCHNPTGADLTDAEWGAVIEILKARNLVPFIDMAYQGFAEGIAEDASTLNLFVGSGLPCFIASSFSKSFSLYGERVGALSVITGSKDETARVLSQIKRVIRTNYSNPPTHAGIIVAGILSTPELKAAWENELATMRNRIRTMRTSFVQKLKAKGVSRDFSFITQQRGMFSYTGLSAEQVARMQSEFGIYAVSTGRICLAAMNTKNIDYVVDAVAAVL